MKMANDGKTKETSTREKAVEKVALNFRVFGVYLSNDEIKALLMVKKDGFRTLVSAIAIQHNIMLI